MHAGGAPASRWRCAGGCRETPCLACAPPPDGPCAARLEESEVEVLLADDPDALARFERFAARRTAAADARECPGCGFWNAAPPPGATRARRPSGIETRVAAADTWLFL